VKYRSSRCNVRPVGKSREGSGRHRQPWIEIVCERCGLTVKARRTLPGKPLHVRTHYDDFFNLCVPVSNDASEDPPSGTMTA